MKLSSVDEAIEISNEHLKITNSFGTEIEAFLVRYILVIICAEFEKSVLDLIVKRVEKTKDTEVTTFVDSIIYKQFRRVRTSEMAGLLGSFNMELKNRFNGEINNTDEQVSFNNIVNNRHNMAHGRSMVQMTFNELCDNYKKSLKILAEFKNVLDLDH
jgi:hypothetical protein